MIGFEEQGLLLLQVAIATILGGVIGWQREAAKKPAGLRTHMFIGAAACSFVLLGDVLPRIYPEFVDNGNLSIDPIRILQSIVVGISFIGAGMIIQDEAKHRVRNLTTAASILVTAATGISVSLDLYVFAVGLTILALLITMLSDSIVHKYAEN